MALDGLVIGLRDTGYGLRTEHRYNVGLDTPLGVIFQTVKSAGTGSVFVVERFRDAVAKAAGFEPEECEVVTIEDLETGKLIWPKESA